MPRLANSVIRLLIDKSLSAEVRLGITCGWSPLSRLSCHTPPVDLYITTTKEVNMTKHEERRAQVAAAEREYRTWCFENERNAEDHEARYDFEDHIRWTEDVLAALGVAEWDDVEV